MKQFRLFYPLKPHEVTQKFGETKFLDYYKDNGINFKGHNGLDLYATHGQPVYATHEGEVVYAGMDAKEGYGVVLRTLEPYEYKGQEVFYKTIYWHLIKDIPVRVGQKVMPGDVIGYADSTGLSTGNHLHFALKPQTKGENDWTWYNLEDSNGYYGAINPLPYFNGIASEDAMSILQTLKSMVMVLTKLISLRK